MQCSRNGRTCNRRRLNHERSSWVTLGCRWVLAGDYAKVGADVRVGIRIMEVAPARVLASEQLEGPMSDLFAIHDRITEFVTQHLNATLSATSPPARSALSAYECYSRAQRLFKKLEKGSMEQGLQLCERAIELARCAPALTGVASIYAMRFTFTTDPAGLARAESYARRAIEADPMSSEPHVWLG